MTEGGDDLGRATSLLGHGSKGGVVGGDDAREEPVSSSVGEKGGPERESCNFRYPLILRNPR
jgi:hypothetical protein